MVRSSRLALLLVAGAGLFVQGPGHAAAQQKTLTLEQTMGHGVPRVSFSAQPAAWSWAPDGVHLVTQKEGKAIWVDPKSKVESAPPVAPVPAAKPAAAGLEEAELVAALAKLPGFDEAAAKRAAGGRFGRSSDGQAVLIASDDDLYFVRAGREKAVRLTFTPQSEENGELSPDGRFASFVRENNLYLVETDGGRERQLTKDGGAEKLNGKLDWVYQEEVYGRGRFKATWWSPASRHVAFLGLEQTGVPHHPIVDHMVDRAVLEDTRYPKSGDPNPKVTLGVVRARDGRVVYMDLGKYDGSEPLVVRVGWSPDGKKLCFQVQDREQTWLDVVYGDPDTGKIETLLHEGSKSWVNVLEEPRWLGDGTFLWFSEHTGYKHLYHYDASGKLLQQITDGPWEVSGIDELDEARKLVWFRGTRDSAIGANLYRIAFDGSGLVRLTQGQGSHSVDWNGDKSLYLDRVSSLENPPEVRLCSGDDGALVEVLATSDIPALAEYGFSRPRRLAIPARDGFLMDASLVAPRDLDEARKYPLWLPTYSGPDAPSVSDRWSGDSWTQFLAQQGYAVFQVNNRTSSNKGLAAISACWKQLGVQELMDLEDALAWLGTQYPWLDTTRVGITGWSYGGFMTAYALTHSKAFKLGVAGAGVYDWRLYDSIYTERYMLTPQHNAEGYAKTSCVEGAKDLSGWLVLAHGSMDDNVHFQNTLQLAMALQKADKDFDMMVYPKSRHGLGSMEQNWHFRRLTWRAIQEKL